MKHTSIFTLAPSDHPKDPIVLERGYKLWSTFAWCIACIYARSNSHDTAGGQSWVKIATKTNGTWYVKSGSGHFAQGGALLARYLIGKRAQVRSEVVAYQGPVRRYAASATVYSLPSIINGMKAVVSRDKEADKRQAARKVNLADLIAARVKRNKEGGA